jgi:hypothetical protein
VSLFFNGQLYLPYTSKSIQKTFSFLKFSWVGGD